MIIHVFITKLVTKYTNIKLLLYFYIHQAKHMSNIVFFFDLRSHATAAK